ncbi:MAG TPA: TetR family transcriptional regulator [Actinomycetota bacterium]|nr:TetR family transcriptional regulator [Actinomycetota bacterium]
MRSIYGADTRPRADLTARARIRDVALEQFAEHGFDGATIRGIAKAAGVSPSLVQHHFGSKDGLRRACDDTVLDLVQRKVAATEDGRIASPDVLASLQEQALPLVRYLARAFVDGSPAGATLVDEIAEGTERFLSATWPERYPPGDRRTRDAAAVLVAQSAGTIVMHEHVARRMGLVPWKDVLSPRIGLAQLDVYDALGEFVASGVGEQIREAVAGLDGRGPEAKE